MANIQETLFGPLSKDYCNVFLFFSFLALIVFIMTLVGAIALVLSKKGKLEWYVGILYGVIMSALQYILFRLLYNMCKK